MLIKIDTKVVIRIIEILKNIYILLVFLHSIKILKKQVIILMNMKKV